MTRRPLATPRPLPIAIALAATLLAGCAATPERAKLTPMTRPTTRVATRPFSRPASRPSYHVSDVYVQELPAQSYVSRGVTTTYPELSRSTNALLAEVLAATAAQGVKLTGPPLIVYRGATASATKPFALDVGFPAASAAKSTGRLALRTLPAMRCACVVLTGPASTIDKGYDRLVPAIEAAGRTRTGEVREVYLRWSGPDAPDNQVLIAIGIE